MAKPRYNPRNANGHRRRELRKRILATQDRCGICGGYVDTGLPHGLDASPELDEIIPVSLGGSPIDPSNVQLAHRLCNSRKSNKLLITENEKKNIKAIKDTPIETSVNW